MGNKEIETIIEDSFRELETVIKEGACESNIIIPNYRNDEKANEENKQKKKGEKRYSEQELKQIFIRRILNQNQLFFSVETPSENIYNFKENPRVIFPNENYDNEDNNFLSARIDVSLYHKANFIEKKPEQNLMSHLEFKYGQCDKKNIQKDFLKLICENNGKNKNYFIHYLYLKEKEINNRSKKTIAAIFSKYSRSIEGVKKEINNRHFSSKELEKRFEKVIIYINFIGLNKKYSFSMADLLSIQDVFDKNPNSRKYVITEAEFEEWKNKKELDKHE